MHTQSPPSPTARGGRPAVALIAGAALALGVGAFALLSGDSGGSRQLDLSLGSSDALASCLPVSADILADMPLAFAGSAISVEGEIVTLRVDRWYTDGEADEVVLHASAGMEALIDGITFVEGGDYLVSATEGSVNFCGFTGPATPELQAVFDDAFAS